MIRSPGFRLFVVGVLALFMFIPLLFVSGVIESRADYNEDAIRTVSTEWGGAQQIGGPVLIIPVEEDVVKQVKVFPNDPVTGKPLYNEDGTRKTDWAEKTVTEARAPLALYPDQYDIDLSSETEIRKRGIFRVPVYAAKGQLTFTFPTDRATERLKGEERLLWDQTDLRIYLAENRSLRGEADLRAGDTALALEPLPADRSRGGIVARTGDPRQTDVFTFALGFNGAGDLSFAPVGRETKVQLTSDWPHPSFNGAFLPDASEIQDTGFTASWTIPHLARPLPQMQRLDERAHPASTKPFGLTFFQPNDFYQKAYRVSRYGILFIAMTFLTVFLIESRSERPAHPVQYILIGLAQAIFALLMVSYAEQIGFGAAYLFASAATIGLLVLYAFIGLKLGRQSWVLGLTLVVLYGVLYLILQTADYALLVGSTLAFVALAGTMYATRNEDWYGPEKPAGPRKPFFGLGGVAPPLPAQEDPGTKTP